MIQIIAIVLISAASFLAGSKYGKSVQAKIVADLTKAKADVEKELAFLKAKL